MAGPERSGKQNVMKNNHPGKKWLQTVGLLLPAIWISGCATSGVQNPRGTEVTELKADERGFVTGTGIESQDLVAISDQIARQLMLTPEIMNATSPPLIVTENLINETRFHINKEIFLSRIRAQVNRQTRGKVRFLARRRMDVLETEKEMKQAGKLTSNTDPSKTAFKGADYFLTGKLQSLSSRTSQGISDYVLYTFQLIDAETSVIVFEDFAEIKKQGLEDAVYR